MVVQPAPSPRASVLDLAPRGVWLFMTRLTSAAGLDRSATQVREITSPTLASLGPLMATTDGATVGVQGQGSHWLLAGERGKKKKEREKEHAYKRVKKNIQRKQSMETSDSNDNIVIYL